MRQHRQYDWLDRAAELAALAMENWPLTLSIAAAAAAYFIMPAGGYRFLVVLGIVAAGLWYNAIWVQRQSEAQVKAGAQRETPEKVWAEINALVGLAPVKEFLREVEAVVRANAARQRKGLPPLKQSMHMCFLGNPGTGKTTVARLAGRLLAALGALPSGHLVETDRSGLVGQYVGHTAPKVWDAVNRAMGGVLFVDEAYSLAGGCQQDFGGEALATLVKAMEDCRDRFVVILAGYTDEMQKLFELNPGLDSRIAFTCEFPDYSPAELVEIAMMEIQNQNFRAAPGVEEELFWIFRNLGSGVGAAGNGRYARKVVERAVRKAVLAGRVDVLEPGDFTALYSQY